VASAAAYDAAPWLPTSYYSESSAHQRRIFANPLQQARFEETQVMFRRFNRACENDARATAAYRARFEAEKWDPLANLWWRSREMTSLDLHLDPKAQVPSLVLDMLLLGLPSRIERRARVVEVVRVLFDAAWKIKEPEMKPGPLDQGEGRVVSFSYFPTRGSQEDPTSPP
jgi:hypothetical protein